MTTYFTMYLANQAIHLQIMLLEQVLIMDHFTAQEFGIAKVLFLVKLAVWIEVAPN